MSLTVSEAVAGRRSTRAFLPDPVAPAMIRRVLEKAGRAPSGGNVQPWHVTVVAGRTLAALKADAHEHREPKPPEYGIYPENLPEPYRSRRFAVGEAMYATMGITRDEKPRRLEWLSRNYQFFGAPLALFIHMPRLMGSPQWADLGMLVQTIMLLLREEGLESCPQEAWSTRPLTVRRHLPIPDDHVLFCGVGVGRLDPTHPVNGLVAERAPLAEWTTFVDV